MRRNITTGAIALAAVLAVALLADQQPAEADTQAQALARQELRTHAAAARACAAGETVHWLDEHSMTCLREVRP